MFKKRVKACNSAPRSSARSHAPEVSECGEQQTVKQNKVRHASPIEKTGTPLTVEELQHRFDPQSINQNKHLPSEDLMDTDERWEMEQLRKTNLSLDRTSDEGILVIDEIKQRIKDRMTELTQELSSIDD